MNNSSQNDGVYATASLTGAKFTSEANTTSSNMINAQQAYPTQVNYQQQTTTSQPNYQQQTSNYQQQTGSYQQQYTNDYQQNSTAEERLRMRNGEGTETGEIRKVSSVIVETHNLQEIPKDTERYVEVPTYEEQITYVPVKEVKEVVKVVPIYDVEYVDRVVEVPKVVYIDKVVEVPEYYDVVTSVHVPKYVDRPVETVREVRVPKTRVVEQEVQVPGGVVYVDKHYNVTKEVEVIHNVNKEVPVIVAQTAKPIIVDSAQATTVDVRDIQPEVMPVDIHLAKPVDSCLQPVGILKSTHKLTNISAAQYNTLLKKLNPDFAYDLPYVSEKGRVDFHREQDMNYVLAPAGVTVEGWTPKNPSNVNVTAAKNLTTNSAIVYQAPKVTQNSSVIPAVYDTTKTTTSKTITTSQAPSTSQFQITVQPQSTTQTTMVSHGARGGSPLMTAPNQYRVAASASSSGSSVSSSINKIAYELEHERQQPQKRSMMCCGGRPSNSVQQQQHHQLTYPPSAQQPMSASITVEQPTVQMVSGQNSSVVPVSYQPVMSYQGTQSFQPSCASSAGAELTMTAQPVRRAKLC